MVIYIEYDSAFFNATDHDGQNIQSRNADIRSETDLKINLQAELETETILEHLEYQNKMIVKILEQIENK